MATIGIVCGSCHARFEVDVRKAGQSSPCPNCHARADVPSIGQDALAVASAVPAAAAHSPFTSTATGSVPRAVIRHAAELFMSLPVAFQLTTVGILCIAVGYAVGAARMAAVRYSAADVQKVSERAAVAEQSLATMTDQYAAMESERSRYKVAAESREKDVASIRKRMNELRAEKGVPEWASAEAWAKAKSEIASTQSLAEKNADLEKRHAADRREITRLRSDLAAIAERRPGNAADKNSRLQPDWDADRNVDPAAKQAADDAVEDAMGDEFSEVLWRRIRGDDDRRWICAGKVSRKIGKDTFREDRVTLTIRQERNGGWTVIDVVFWTEK